MFLFDLYVYLLRTLSFLFCAFSLNAEKLSDFCPHALCIERIMLVIRANMGIINIVHLH